MLSDKIIKINAAIQRGDTIILDASQFKDETLKSFARKCAFSKGLLTLENATILSKITLNHISTMSQKKVILPKFN